MNSDSENFNGKVAITIFASGNGSNAENLMQYFHHHNSMYINLVITNNENAGVIEKAKKFSVPVQVISKEKWVDTDWVIHLLLDNKTNWIVLAGFLKLLHQDIIHMFPHKIINIHPALLPKYGGRGMFGKAIHQRVFKAHEPETGITIHEVNEEYDAGSIIFQESIPIFDNDTPESIENKVRELELKYFPLIIEEHILHHIINKEKED